MTGALRLLILSLLTTVPVSGSVDSELRPMQIVSINPCLDAILVRVADHRQVAAISHYSQQARATSIPLALARSFSTTSGTAEEMVALSPDVVLVNAGTAPATILALRRMRVRIAEFGLPQSVAQSEQQVRRIAAIAGHPERGKALVARIEAAVRPLPLLPVPALIWGGGLVPGMGTLPDELLKRAGFRNMSAVYGLKQWDVLPLEYLIARPPRVLLSVPAAESGDDRLSEHPAVRRLARQITVVPYADRLLNCGGPTIIDAMVRLKAVRRAVER